MKKKKETVASVSNDFVVRSMLCRTFGHKFGVCSYCVEGKERFNKNLKKLKGTYLKGKHD